MSWRQMLVRVVLLLSPAALPRLAGAGEADRVAQRGAARSSRRGSTALGLGW